jgi:DNA-binding CsgD family transcriptional regulator
MNVTLKEVEFFSIREEIIVSYRGKSYTWKNTPVAILHIIWQDYERLPLATRQNIEMNYGEGTNALREFVKCKYTSYHYRCKNCPHRIPICKKNASISRRQTEILAFLVAGYSYKEISMLINITDSALRKHVHRLKTRLNVSTQAALAVYALKNNFS